MLQLPLLIAVLVAQGAAQTAGPPAPQGVDARRKQLADLLDEHWEYAMRTSPEYASILGDKRYNDKLTDYSEKAVFDDIEAERQFLARFQAIDTSGFPEQEALNQSLMVRQIQVALAGVRFKDWEMPVSQFSGIHINAPQLVSLLSFETVKDYDDYIARLRQLPTAFRADHRADDEGDGGRADAAAHPAGAGGAAVHPDRRRRARAEPFFDPARKIPAGFPDPDKARIREEMLVAIRDGVRPAYQQFARFVREQYAPKGRAEPGVWALPDGAARYAYAVEQTTTTKMSPEEIHQLGLREVARDRALMLKIAKKLGYKNLKAFDAAIAKNPKLHPKSREQMLELYRKYNRSDVGEAAAILRAAPQREGGGDAGRGLPREGGLRRPVRRRHGRREAARARDGEHL